MALHYYSSCPFCRTVFEHDGGGAQVRIDASVRYVCLACVKRLTPSLPPPSEPLRPNGDAR
jgi:hypothetical protein